MATWCEDLTHWKKNTDAGKDWSKEKGVTEDEKVEWHHQLNGHEFGQTPGNGEGQGCLACCSWWGPKEFCMTEGLKNNNKFIFCICLIIFLLIFLWISLFVLFLDFTYNRYHMVLVFLCMTDFIHYAYF